MPDVVVVSLRSGWLGGRLQVGWAWWFEGRVVGRGGVVGWKADGPSLTLARFRPWPIWPRSPPTPCPILLRRPALCRASPAHSLRAPPWPQPSPLSKACTCDPVWSLHRSPCLWFGRRKGQLSSWHVTLGGPHAMRPPAPQALDVRRTLVRLGLKLDAHLGP